MESKWHNAPRCCIKEIFHLLLSWGHGSVLLWKTFSSEVVFFVFFLFPGKWNVWCFSPRFLICRETALPSFEKREMLLILFFVRRNKELCGKFWDLQIKRKYRKCTRRLLRVRINSQVSTKPYVWVDHSMAQSYSCSTASRRSKKLFQRVKIEKAYTGCVWDRVLTTCIKYRNADDIS